jgi:hypothetical protein
MIRNRVLLTLAAILMIIRRSLGLVRLRLGVVDPSDDRIARRTGHDGCEINDQREVSQRTAPHGARAAIRFAETQRTRTTSIVSIADTLPGVRKTDESSSGPTRRARVVRGRTAGPSFERRLAGLGTCAVG